MPSVKSFICSAPRIRWIGLKMNRSVSEVQILQVYS